MYKNNSRNAQDRANRLTLKDLVHDVEVTTEEEIDALLKSVKHLEIALKDETSPHNRKQMGYLINQYNHRIAEIRPKKPVTKDFNFFFRIAAKEFLRKIHYEIVYNQAQEMAKRHEAKQQTASD